MVNRVESDREIQELFEDESKDGSSNPYQETRSNHWEQTLIAGNKVELTEWMIIKISKNIEEIEEGEYLAATESHQILSLRKINK